MKIRQLVDRYGSAVATLAAPQTDIAQFPGFGPKVMASWGKWQVNEEVKRVEKEGATVIPYTSSHYPERLKSLPDFPLILYVKGKLLDEKQPAVSIVGTRKATIYGKEIALRFGEELARAGVCVMSGLARGIDTAAHEGALLGGKTVAVIGSGLARVYPTENKRLAAKIAEHGAIISEYPMHAPPHRHHFPRRNRIVSGLGDAVLLIEAPLISGAMITMELAKKQGKRLYALPGRVDQENFKGNLHLLKTREARIVDQPEDILDDFDLSPQKKNDRSQIQPFNPEEVAFINLLPEEEISLEEIALLAKVPIAKLNILLMSLTLKRVLKEYPGKVYRKTLE